MMKSLTMMIMLMIASCLLFSTRVSSLNVERLRAGGRKKHGARRHTAKRVHRVNDDGETETITPMETTVAGAENTHGHVVQGPHGPVVVTKKYCSQIIEKIQKKEAPYWDEDGDANGECSEDRMKVLMWCGLFPELRFQEKHDSYCQKYCSPILSQLLVKIQKKEAPYWDKDANDGKGECSEDRVKVVLSQCDIMRLRKIPEKFEEKLMFYCAYSQKIMDILYPPPR